MGRRAIWLWSLGCAPGLLFGLTVVAVIAATGSRATVAVAGVPPRALQAYVDAAELTAERNAGCHLRWTIVAAVAQIESTHAAGHRIDALGNVTPPIIGAPLDGTAGRAAVADTDHGTYDDDTVHDRALGPLQILPATWRDVRVDGNNDGRRDPQNIDDASAGAAELLCRSGDLRDLPTLRHALLGYNSSDAYVAAVLDALAVFDAAANGAMPGNERAEAAIAAALTQIGKPYVWGATGPDSYDCSGLTQWAYAQAGVSLPRTSREQWNAGPHPTVDDLRRGDLLFYANDVTDPSTIYHVAMYVGAGNMIEAPHTGASVRTRLVRLRYLIGVVRPSAPADP
jgi:cell wall-associated NlpC family hydrolase